MWRRSLVRVGTGLGIVRMARVGVGGPVLIMASVRGSIRFCGGIFKLRIVVSFKTGGALANNLTFTSD